MRIPTYISALAIVGITNTFAATAATPRTLPAASSTSTSQSFEPGRLERVEALHDPVIEGAVSTWYTQGYRLRARELQHFITGERDFIKQQLA